MKNIKLFEEFGKNDPFPIARWRRLARKIGAMAKKYGFKESGLDKPEKGIIDIARWVRGEEEEVTLYYETQTKEVLIHFISDGMSGNDPAEVWYDYDTWDENFPEEDEE